MKDFLEVFPDDLIGISPEWEIEDAIDVLENIQPISNPLYIMTPTELKDLNEQLKDFLDKGFIQLTISSWGAPILFVRNKDESL